MDRLDSIPPIRTAKVQVYDALQEAILRGTIRSGEPITESQVAEQLGVSRTPVREAIQELEREGLLESHGARGKRVRAINEEEVIELFWLRQAIECAVVERLLQHNTNKIFFDKLDDLIQQQRDLFSQDKRDEFLEVDDQFHNALVEETGFQKASEIMSNLKLITRLVSIRAVTKLSRFQEILSEHAAIVDALRAADIDRARQAMHLHLSRTRTAVLESIAEKKNA